MRSDKGQEIDAEKLIRHDRYQPDPILAFDIGLVKLQHKYDGEWTNCDL